MKKGYVRLCPKCGSHNVKPQQSAVGGGVLGAFVPVPTFQCDDCGFEGAIPEVHVDEVKKFREEIKKVDKK